MLRDDDQPVGVISTDDIVLVDQAQTGLPVDRRCDRRISKLHSRVINQSLIAPDGGRQLRDKSLLRLDALFRRYVASGELRDALEIELGYGELRFIAYLGGLRLRQLRLIGPRIDLRQEVAGLDALSFSKRDSFDLTVDTRSYRHGIEGLHGADPTQVDRHVLSLGRTGNDGHRGSHCGAGRR